MDSIRLILNHWFFTRRLKRCLKELVKLNRKTLRGLLPRREIRRVVRLSRNDCRWLFHLEHHSEQIDMSRVKTVNKELGSLKLTEPPQRLVYDGAVRLESAVVKRVFHRAFGLELRSQDVVELQYWDSPVAILKAFVSYCLQYEDAIVGWSMSKKQIFGLFLMNASEHILGRPVERPADLANRIKRESSDREEFWRQRQILAALEALTVIHRRSVTIVDALGNASSIIVQRLEHNHAAFYDRIQAELRTTDQNENT